MLVNMGNNESESRKVKRSKALSLPCHEEQIVTFWIFISLGCPVKFLSSFIYHVQYFKFLSPCSYHMQYLNYLMDFSLLLLNELYSTMVIYLHLFLVVRITVWVVYSNWKVYKENKWFWKIFEKQLLESRIC